MFGATAQKKIGYSIEKVFLVATCLTFAHTGKVSKTCEDNHNAGCNTIPNYAILSLVCCNKIEECITVLDCGLCLEETIKCPIVMVIIRHKSKNVSFLVLIVFLC